MILSVWERECGTELHLQRSGFNYRSVSGLIHQLGVLHIGVQCRISHRKPQALQKQRVTAHRAWSLCADLYHLPGVGQQHQDNLHLFPVVKGLAFRMFHSSLLLLLCPGTLNSCGRSKEYSAYVAWRAFRKPLRDSVPGSELEWHLRCLLLHFRYLLNTFHRAPGRATYSTLFLERQCISTYNAFISIVVH